MIYAVPECKICHPNRKKFKVYERQELGGLLRDEVKLSAAKLFFCSRTAVCLCPCLALRIAKGTAITKYAYEMKKECFRST